MDVLNPELHIANNISRCVKGQKTKTENNKHKIPKRLVKEKNEKDNPLRKVSKQKKGKVDNPTLCLSGDTW